MMRSDNKNSTPAPGATAIVAQRIYLIGFFVVISAMTWWQNTGDISTTSIQKVSSTPLPQAVAGLDFTNAEASWAGLRIDPQGNLEIDALTESALSDAVALLDEQGSELQLARMAFLLEKQFGLSASQQIMELLPRLRNYKEREQRWWDENGSRNPPAYAELFELQNELLGEQLAAKLFSEQRRLAKLMLASHQIRSDPGLTQLQKEQALTELQNAFQEEAPNE